MPNQIESTETPIDETDAAVTLDKHDSFSVTDRYRHFVLAMLVAVGVFSWVDRQIFAVLLESIKLEFSFSDTQLGLLGGLAFGLFYATVGLPIAWLCDKFNRRNIIVIALGLWSLMTALCGTANSFITLFLARMGVGVGEAGGSPPAQSMICDYFPPERRAYALGFYFMLIPLGTLVGFLVGGWVNEFFGWRNAFLVVGLPGVIYAIFLVFMLKEPPRGHSENKKITRSTPSLLSTVKYFLSRPTLRHVPIAGAIHGIGAWGAALWLPAYFMRTHGMTSGEVGTWFAFIFGFAGAGGTLIGGYVVDRIVKTTGDSRWYMWCSALVILVSTPFSFAVYLWPTPVPALLILIIPVFIGHMFLGPVTATIQNLAGVRRRAMGAAFYLFLANMISMGFGPLIIGMTSDYFNAEYGNDSLRYSLLTLTIITSIWAPLHFFLAARTLRQDLELAKADN